MNDHVLDELADLLEGRCTPQRRLLLQQHLDACAECSEALAFLSEFQGAALAQGRMHLRAERIVALSTTPESILEVEQRHLDRCAACRGELDWAKERPGEGAHVAGPRTKRPLLRRWPLAAAAAAVLSVSALYLFRGVDDASNVAVLARIEPMRVPLSRSVAEMDSFAKLRLGAFEHYRDARYESARASLQAALELAPDNAEILLYLGSTELLLRNAPRALQLLQVAVQRSDEPPLSEQILWQLAQAQLTLGDGEAATQTLEQVLALQRGHAAQAQELLEALRP